MGKRNCAAEQPRTTQWHPYWIRSNNRRAPPEALDPGGNRMTVRSSITTMLLWKLFHTR